MSCLFIIDLDNTVADGSRRFKKAGKEPSRKNKKEYDAWVKAVQNAESLAEDKDVPGMGVLLGKLWGTYSPVEYVTSREEKWKQITEKWLIRNHFPLYDVTYRPDGDYSETHELKERQITELSKGYEEVVVIDDDPSGKLAKVCKKRGWTLLKVIF
jgi:hypothetical protein